jgi:hypothetical protein
VFLYNLYGLHIKSQWDLRVVQEAKEPGLADFEFVEGPPSFFFEASQEASKHPQENSWYRYAKLLDGREYLFWPGICEILVSADGRCVTGHLLASDCFESWSTYIFGQSLSYALLKRAIEHLHGTAVVVDGEALGFIGDCGYGKSSLAAGFLRAGYPQLSDDLLILSEAGKRLLAHPGFSRIKLFPEIARSLLGDRAVGTPMNPFTRKLIIPLDPGLSFSKSAALKTLFVLRPPNPRSPGKQVTIRRLSPRQAFLALTENTFNARVRDPDRLKRLFNFASRIALKVPVKSLSYPRDLNRLPEVVGSILKSTVK